MKICGVTRPEDARLAAEEGADAIGVVFWQGSPRHVEPSRAKEIMEALPPKVLRVGVFVDTPLTELERIVEEVRLDVLQLHGQEPPEDLPRLPRRCWKAVRVGPGFVSSDALRYEGRAAALLLDSGNAPGALGGTGRTFDWQKAREVRRRASSLILAGGLDSSNVGLAVKTLCPDGVDVSSGVESEPGLKDPKRVRAFVRAAREAS